MRYFIKTLRYLKLVEPNLNIPNFLKRIGMPNAQIIKVMQEYNKGEQNNVEFR
jgi:hypothetical protein